eukprot:6751739-Pyramimonas_sp.AAC.1
MQAELLAGLQGAHDTVRALKARRPPRDTELAAAAGPISGLGAAGESRILADLGLRHEERSGLADTVKSSTGAAFLSLFPARLLQ